MSPSEYYVREVTTDDLKFAQQATDVINAAYNTHGTVISYRHDKKKKLNFLQHARWLDH